MVAYQGLPGYIFVEQDPPTETQPGSNARSHFGTAHTPGFQKNRVPNGVGREAESSWRRPGKDHGKTLEKPVGILFLR